MSEMANEKVRKINERARQLKLEIRERQAELEQLRKQIMQVFGIGVFTFVTVYGVSPTHVRAYDRRGYTAVRHHGSKTQKKKGNR